MAKRGSRVLRAFPDETQASLTAQLQRILAGKLAAPTWEGWGGTLDVNARLARFWDTEHTQVGVRHADHIALQRQLLDEIAPLLGSDVKLELLYKRAYPLRADPHQISPDTYLALLADYHVQRSTAACYGEGNVIGPADRRVRNVLLASIATVLFAVMLIVADAFFFDKNAMTYDEAATDDVKLARQQTRGTIASIAVAVSFGVMNFVLDWKGQVNPATSVALVQLCFGGTLGFLSDNFFGSDFGFALLREEGAGAAWRHALGQLATASYLRYVLTVLLDVFITLILFKPLYVFASKLPFFRCGNQALASALSGVLIGIITFQAYANITRFGWAYPSTTSRTKSDWISGGTMQVCTALACVVFLTSDTQVNPGEPGVNNPTVKLFVVLGALGLMSALAKLGASNPQLDLEVVPVKPIHAAPRTSQPVDYRQDDVVLGHEFLNTESGEPLDANVRFVVTKRLATGGYQLVPENPRFTYKYAKQSAMLNLDPRGRAAVGASVLLVLGLFVFGFTILGTSNRKRGLRWRMFAVFMAMTGGLAAPGLCC